MSTRRILVIDDDDVIRQVIQGCFEDVAGWEVFTASSGQEGLENAVAEEPDAILLDITMPQMSGLRFLYVRSKYPTIYCIPVVLLTSRVEFADPNIFHEMSVRGIIGKPFNPFVLVRQVAEILSWELEDSL
ncbi:MAG: response regulator [Actinomycetota bacterium]